MTYLVAPEVEKNKSIEAGLSIVQQFEISDPIAQVCWDKDGTQIYPHSGLDRQSKGSMRTLFIQPDDMSCGGRFDCQTTGDTTQFNVAIKGGAPHKPFSTPYQNLTEAFTWLQLSSSLLFSLWLCSNSRAVSPWQWEGWDIWWVFPIHYGYQRWYNAISTLALSILTQHIHATNNGGELASVFHPSKHIKTVV